MSHPSNEEYLERSLEEFAQADDAVERAEVVRRMRDEGFTEQADSLTPYIQEGMDESLLD